jgi:transcriptional regulator with XRE-family HTH domain
MARRKSTPPKQLAHQWYLVEWAERLGVRQKDAIDKLGWSKAQASDIFNGKQRYTADLVDEVAQWLHLAPHELLMHPTDAMAMRAVRESAARMTGPVAAGDLMTKKTG